MAHRYDMSNPVALPDLGVVGGNPGTGANIASNPVGVHGKSQCASFNGNTSNYNLGDVAELNAVTAFTIAFWMRQNVIAASDNIYNKSVDVSNRVNVSTGAGPLMYVIVANGANRYGQFDYSVVMNASQWHHLAVVFDGSQTGDAGRLKAYVDAAPVTMTYPAGNIPAATVDMVGQDMTIGAAAVSFDGLLDAFAIFSRPLTQLQVADHMLATRQNRL